MLVDQRMGKRPKSMKNAADDPPLRSDLTLEDMQAALREHGRVDLAADSLGLAASNFHALWARRAERDGLDLTPRGYLKSEGLIVSQTNPLVSFRCPEYDELADAAEALGFEGVSELAKDVLHEWLKRHRKKAKKA